MGVLDRLLPWRARSRSLESAVERLSEQRAWMAAEISNVTAKLDAYSSRRSAGEEWTTQQPTLRRRLRGLYDNNDLMAGIVDQVVEGMLQSDGILPSLETPDEALNEDVEAAFMADASALDLKGIRGLWELQATWISEFLIAGESMDYWGVLDGQFFSEPFEPEQLASFGASASNTNTISDGIEYDPFGRRVAYWVTPTQPGVPYSAIPVRVEASRVSHWMGQPLRPTQWRGRSEFAQTAIPLHDLTDADLAELTAIRASAYFGLHIKPMDDAPTEATLPTALGAAPSPAGKNSEYSVSMRPGGINTIPADVSLLDGKRPGNQYVPFHTKREQNIGARHRLPYHKISGDMSQVSYSSAVISELVSEQRFECAMARMAERKLRPLFRAWLNVNWLSGRISLGSFTPDEAMRFFSPQFNGFPWIDGANKARAIEEKIRLGVWTWPQVIERYSPGKTARRQLEALKKAQQLRDESGIPIPLVGQSGVVEPDGGDGGSGTSAPPPRNPSAASTNGRPRP